MSNTAGFCKSAKSEFMSAQHNLDSGGAHNFKMALYLTTATVNSDTTVYSATNEVSGGGYTAGGAAVTKGAVSVDTGVGIWTPAANLTWANITANFDAALLYNTSASNKAIAVFTFGSQGLTASGFTLTMPTNNASSALIRLS